MATEDWQLVGDIICNPKYLGHLQPPYELPSTMFVMDFKIKMKSAQSSGDHEEIIDDWDFRLDGLEYNPYALWLAIDKALRNEQVPSRVRAAIEDPILKGTRAARVDSSYGACKYLHMEVDVEFHVGANYEPAFVPASEVSISKLEKTRVDEVLSSTMCTVCMENMKDGSEATRLPCSHLYHENCIVEWLRKSGVCPCCKFRMPTEGDA